MKKLFAFTLVVVAALLSMRLERSHEPAETPKNSDTRASRVFELARAEDGRLDVSVLLASNRLPDERKHALLNADENQDGFLTQDELATAIPALQIKSPLADEEAVANDELERENQKDTESAHNEQNNGQDKGKRAFADSADRLRPPVHKNEMNRRPKPPRPRRQPGFPPPPRG